MRVAVISNVQNVRLQRRHRRQTTTPLVDGVVHNRLVQQTMTHLLRHHSGVTRNSGDKYLDKYGQISKSSPPSPFPICLRLPLSLPLPYLPLFLAPCGAGAPLLGSSPCPFTFSSFPPFTFLFLSLALPIFFFCPSLPFLPE